MIHCKAEDRNLLMGAMIRGTALNEIRSWGSNYTEFSFSLYDININNDKIRSKLWFASFLVHNMGTY